MQLCSVLFLWATAVALANSKNINKRSLVSRFTNNPLFLKFFSHQDDDYDYPTYSPTYWSDEDYYSPASQYETADVWDQYDDSRQDYYGTSQYQAPDVWDQDEEIPASVDFHDSSSAVTEASQPYAEIPFNTLPWFDRTYVFRTEEEIRAISTTTTKKEDVGLIFNSLPWYERQQPFRSHYIGVLPNLNRLQIFKTNLDDVNVITGQVPQIFRLLPIYDRPVTFYKAPNLQISTSDLAHLHQLDLDAQESQKFVYPSRQPHQVLLKSSKSQLDSVVPVQVPVPVPAQAPVLYVSKAALLTVGVTEANRATTVSSLATTTIAESSSSPQSTRKFDDEPRKPFVPRRDKTGLPELYRNAVFRPITSSEISSYDYSKLVDSHFKNFGRRLMPKNRTATIADLPLDQNHMAGFVYLLADSYGKPATQLKKK